MDMYDMYGVWTINPDQEWVKKNAGVEEMLLTVIQGALNAYRVMDRLYEMYGDPYLFVRKMT